MQLKELISVTDSLFYADKNSYKVIRSKQKELLNFIKPSINIKKIDYKIINSYIEFLKNKNNSNTTINAKLSYLNHILNYAYHNNLIDNKPYIPCFKVTPQKFKTITPLELSCLIWKCREHNFKSLAKILLIGYYTGLRINNILSLRKSNIDNNKFLIKDIKTKSYYTIPISNKIKFITDNFKPFDLKYQQVYYQFNLIKQELKLDKQITIHTLRHSFCSNLINKGVPITTIQKLANHKKLTTTVRYSHINEQELQKAISML